VDFSEIGFDIGHVSRAWLDVPYAPTSAAQRLDLYLPDTGKAPFPTLIYVHGGAFAYGGKRDPQMLPFLQGLARGYAVISVGYRLSGEAIFPAGLQDVKAAVRWARANSEEHSLDPARLVICGDSAGGNLAAMVAVTANEARFDDPALGNSEYPCDVRVAVDWFGLIDFLTMDEQFAASGLSSEDHSGPESFEAQYLGGPVFALRETARLAGPLPYIKKGIAPILIQHGRSDDQVPYQQSLQLADALESRVGKASFELDLLEGEGAGHGGPAFETEANLDRVFAFIGKHLG
jgi:acetyl esterase/lipase